MNSEKQRAKDIFFEYACRTQFMARDGVLQNYERFGVSAEEEQQWRHEYVEIWLERLSIDDLTAIRRLRDAEAVEALPTLLARAHEGDSYARLFFANTIASLATRNLIEARLREQAMDVAVRLWRSILDEPLKLSETHRSQIKPIFMSALDASTPEEYVQNFAIRMLAEYNR